MSIIENKYQKCIDECNSCAQKCLECIEMCLGEPDVRLRRQSISSMMECASICREAAFFMGFNARHSLDVCRLCAVICDKCAEECSAFKDDHSIACAAACKACSQSCNSMGK